MKITRRFAFVSLAALLITAGCSTLQVAIGTRIVVRRATVEVLKKHPEYKPAIQASAVAIDQLLLQPELDREKITAALQSLKIREIKGSDGALLLQDVLDLIDAAIADKPIVGEGLPKLKAFLEAASAGLSEGVALSP